MIIIGLFGLLLVWRGIVGAGPVQLTDLPQNVPPVVTLYRQGDAQSIEYRSGKEQNKMLSFFRGASAPLQQMDTVVVRWEELDTSREDVLRFYQELFERNKFVVQSARDGGRAIDTIVAQRDDVVMNVRVQDLPDVPGVDNVTVIINYLSE